MFRFLKFKKAITELKATNPAASSAVEKDEEHNSKNAPTKPTNL